MSMHTISFIIPVKPGGYVSALNSICALSTPVSIYEVIVVEGNSPSHQRNTAAKAASGEFLFFLDDDSIITDNCIDRCLQAFKNQSVAVVGGPSLTPASDSVVQHIWSYALTSMFGSGAVRNRYQSKGIVRETSDKELILCNLAVRRTVFEDMRGFDERLYPNEENELLERIQLAGYKLIHDPDMSICRSQRESINAFVHQMFSYGKGRAKQTIISKRISFISFAPLFFLLYCMILPLMPVKLYLPFLAYILLDMFFTLMAMLRSKKTHALLLFLVFPLMHLVNGAGLLCGLLNRNSPKRNKFEIIIKNVKGFGQSCHETL